MKVFAPGRVIWYSDITIGSVKYGFGVPLGGDWIDVDDYFRQITSGHSINDVIHAKPVASTGVPYTCGDLVDERGVYYPSSFRSGPTTYMMLAPFTTSNVEEYYYPNYKGKKKIIPRRRKRTLRNTHGVAIQVGAGSSSSRPMVSGHVYLHCPLSDDEQGMRFGFKDLYFTVKWDTRTKAYTGRSSSIYLAAFEEAISYEMESRFGKDPYKRPLTEFYEIAGSMVYNATYGLLWTMADAVARTAKASYRTSFAITSTSVNSPVRLEDAFLLHENDIFVGRVDPVVLRGYKDFSGYWKNYLMEHALLEALESFPRLSDNSISNALEALGFIKSLVVDHRIEIPKSLSSAWLAYRYQYKTTELDVMEAIHFVKRHLDLGTLDQRISCYGVSSVSYQDTTITCRCTCDVFPQIVKTAERLIRTLDTFGLKPNMYTAWDMTPFSFMVDWFVPIGTMLGVEDANAKFLSGEFYKIKNICYSLSYTRRLNNSVVKCYTRWKGSVPSSLNSFYWLEPASTSGKTTVFRVLDAASIFIGF